MQGLSELQMNMIVKIKSKNKDHANSDRKHHIIITRKLEN